MGLLRRPYRSVPGNGNGKLVPGKSAGNAVQRGRFVTHVNGASTCVPLREHLKGGGQNEEAIYSGIVDIGNGVGGPAYGPARCTRASHRKRIVAGYSYRSVRRSYRGCDGDTHKQRSRLDPNGDHNQLRVLPLRTACGGGLFYQE